MDNRINNTIKSRPDLTAEEFYHLKLDKFGGLTMKQALDRLLFPNGAPRGVYYCYYKNRVRNR